MFTGIIETVGTVRQVHKGRGGATFTIDASFSSEPLVSGESIAVDGPCLTVEKIPSNGFTAFASSETLDRTTLGGFRPGRVVNLERAMKADGRFGGHIVSGHVDGVGKVGRIAPSGQAREFTIKAPAELMAFLAPKGSVAVNGISLTVNQVADGSFTLMIIPHTLAGTTLSRLGAGDEVNLEADVIARYVASFLASGDVVKRKPAPPRMLEMLELLDQD